MALWVAGGGVKSTAEVTVERDRVCISALGVGAFLTSKSIAIAKGSYGEQGSVLTKKWSERNRDFLAWGCHTQQLAFLKVRCETLLSLRTGSCGGSVHSLKWLLFFFLFC